MSNVMDFINQNSGDFESYDSVYLADIGDQVLGRIIGNPHTADTQFGPRLIIDLETIEGTNCQKKGGGNQSPATVGDCLSLWVKPGNAMAALKTAITAAGAKGVAAGGTLAMKLVDKEDVGKGNPLNKHQAQYKAPEIAVRLDADEDLF